MGVLTNSIDCEKQYQETGRLCCAYRFLEEVPHCCHSPDLPPPPMESHVLNREKKKHPFRHPPRLPTSAAAPFGAMSCILRIDGMALGIQACIETDLAATLASGARLDQEALLTEKRAVLFLRWNSV